MERRVLVVDDEELIVEGLTLLFAFERIESAGACDRQSAMARLAEAAYPVIVTDLCLETNDEGFALIDEIRRLTPASRIVMMTGYATPEIEAEALRRGVSLVLRKPAAGEEILAAVNELLEEVERAAAAQETLNLEELYLNARRLLHSIPMRKYGLSADEAEDVVQEAWLLFLQKRGFIASARAWLAGTVVNLCRQQIDRSRRRNTEPLDEAFALPVARNEVRILATRQALQRVDARARKLCTMIVIEGRSYDEVSASTGLPLGSIGPLFIRAKKSMRKVMDA